MSSDLPKSTQQQPLAGKRAVVTGAGSGIGRAIAVILAESGADLLIQTRANRAGLESTRKETERFGATVETVLADFSRMTAAEREFATADEQPGTFNEFVCQAVERLGGRIDIWINAAGADILTGERAKWSMAEKLELLWAVDVRPTVMLSREAGRRMKEQACGGATEGGAIVNIGWDGADRGMAGDSAEAFAAAKGAIAAFSRSLAYSLAPHVRVNCLAPGWIKTAWGESADPHWQARACRESLLRRWGTPDEVARVVRFLVSQDAALVNGQVIEVNGGFCSSAEE